MSPSPETNDFPLEKTHLPGTELHQTELHQEEEKQTNFSCLVSSWLRDVLTLAQKSHIEETVTHLETLDVHLRLPHFRIAFIGMFSCGKSTLINRLLGRSVLPSREYPTTAAITSIVAGAEEQMEIYRSNNALEQKIRSIKEESWHDFLLDDRLSQARTFPQIRVTLKHAWLSALNIEIVDTPGVDDLNDAHAVLVSETLSQCDAALLVVNAAFPLSLTEMEFLKQKVLGYHVARVIVVVTKIDTIAVSERANVFNRICERVAQVSSSILVLPSYPIGVSTTEETLENVRLSIEEIATNNHRHDQRNRQAAEITLEHLHHLIDYGHMALASVRMDKEKREKNFRQAREEMYAMTSRWNDLLIEMEKRRSRLYDQLHQMLFDARDQLVKTALDEILQAVDLKLWQEKFFRYLRREFLALAHKSQSLLMNAITEDIDWLENSVLQLFGINTSYSNVGTVKSLELKPDIQETMVDLRGWYIFVRFVSGTISTICDIAFSPLTIGGDINQLISTFSEVFFNTKADQRRLQLSHDIEQGIDQNIEEYALRMSMLLQQIYIKVFQDVKQTQNAWETARFTILQASQDSMTDEKWWEHIVAEATLLRDNILAALTLLQKIQPTGGDGV